MTFKESYIRKIIREEILRESNRPTALDNLRHVHSTWNRDDADRSVYPNGDGSYTIIDPHPSFISMLHATGWTVKKTRDGFVVTPREGYSSRD